jgi:hypothetical protein
MSYSLDPKREMSWLVIDRTSMAGMEGVYAGSYEDCEAYLSEATEFGGAFGMDIIPNPYYKK